MGPQLSRYFSRAGPPDESFLLVHWRAHTRRRCAAHGGRGAHLLALPQRPPARVHRRGRSSRDRLDSGFAGACSFCVANFE